MADQRPFSRFRLPWLSAVTAPQPQLQPQTTRPIEIVAPPQPQRPPFRPPGIAQLQQPTQPPPTTQPQPSSPAASRAPTQTRTTVPPSPSPSPATTQPKAASVPSSPAREASATSKTRSPSRAAPQPRAASVPPSLTQQELKPAVSLQEAAEKVKAAEQGKRDADKLKAKDFSSQPKQDKKTFSTGSSEEQIKLVSSTHPKLSGKLTESHKKPGMLDGEQVPLQKEIRDDITKFVHKLATGQLKYPTDDKTVSIVTIASENRGASMHVASEPVTKEGSIRIHRGYKLNPYESAGTTTDAGESKKRKHPKNPTEEEPLNKTFLNSNTQSINNSMLLETSVTEGSPGIHLVVSQNLAEPSKSEPLETHRAEVSVTPAHKLTYDPTIRRRCLRGLFLESSDSDPDNPEKPRRHGCRYYCGERSKDQDIGIF